MGRSDSPSSIPVLPERKVALKFPGVTHELKADRRSLASGSHQNQTDTMTDDSGGGERAGERERTIEGARPTSASASAPAARNFPQGQGLDGAGLTTHVEGSTALDDC